MDSELAGVRGAGRSQHWATDLGNRSNDVENDDEEEEEEEEEEPAEHFM